MSAHVHFCTAEDMHPYNCFGPGKCSHCDRTVSATHDPRLCALCDPEYDFQPNEHRPASSRSVKP